MFREQCFSLWGEIFSNLVIISQKMTEKKHKKSFVLLKDFSAIF
jgi:hypothetical protein